MSIKDLIKEEVEKINLEKKAKEEKQALELKQGRERWAKGMALLKPFLEVLDSYGIVNRSYLTKGQMFTNGTIRWEIEITKGRMMSLYIDFTSVLPFKVGEGFKKDEIECGDFNECVRLFIKYVSEQYDLTEGWKKLLAD